MKKQSTSSQADSQSNMRKFRRFSFKREIALIIEGSKQVAHSLNISRGGIFIEVEPVPDFGSKVKLLMSLPAVEDKCEIPCIVRWTVKGINAGLQFEKLRAVEAWGLNKLIHTLKSSGD
ncbi:MAG: PilZ domain-containing protein [Proteobacteria bacterium]|nr:PilZ domain-containing protein [Pseudomonadota bacterium]